MREYNGVYLARNTILTGDLVLSTGVNIWYGCVLRGDIARITIQEKVNLQDGCIVHTDYDAPLLIEAGVVAGHGAIIHGRRVGAGTMVAMGATLLSGSDIGEECLIAAGSLVTEGKKIPPRSVVMGVPGKIVRSITDEEIARTRDINRRYLELAQRYARGEIAMPFGREHV
jgi:carbonic anhydrase/acetyltransferase-like protein (isoleucine patch superfamily)